MVYNREPVQIWWKESDPPTQLFRELRSEPENRVDSVDRRSALDFAFR